MSAVIALRERRTGGIVRDSCIVIRGAAVRYEGVRY